ncbi:amino acid ABC transporter permease [Thiofilum flexile]|uniref:amino acid ABC transporter permease n=1 Tax=Thiofilum flexile TaxID=125627 RepID=UPI0003669C61|nr:amino acid ABC transporter permease [Thiofilum flexile]
MANATPQAAPSKPSLWNDPQKRGILIQVLVLAAIFAFFGFIFYNTLSNYAQRGISTGFGFLNNTAGFGISQTLIPYQESDNYWQVFKVGLLNTLLVAGLGIVTATILGFIVGVARLSKNWLLSTSAAVYIETFRNIPVLLQIVFLYALLLKILPSAKESYSFAEAVFVNKRGFYVPEPIPQAGFDWTIWAFVLAVALVIVLRWIARKVQEKTGQQWPMFWIGVALIIGAPLVTYFMTGRPLEWSLPVLKGFNFQGGIRVIPELVVLWIALSVYTAAFIAEIVRSGIQSVSHGQTEAANALGLRHNQTLKLVVIPQAMRVIIPQLTSQYLNLTKNTSLATAIAYPDLVAVFAGTTLNQSGQAIEIIFMTMMFYLSVSLLISLFMNWYNNKMALVER